MALRNQDFPASVNLHKIKSDDFEHFELNKSLKWVQELILELNEKVSNYTDEQIIEDSDLVIELEMKKSYKPNFSYYILVRGKIQAHFKTECVISLQEMSDKIECEFKACFLEHNLAEEPEYSDLDEIFIDSDMYDLHFYEKNIADIKEMVHEYIYLNINPYPSLEDATLDKNKPDKNQLH